MPRRLALRLLIAWLAWIPLVSAQGPNPPGPQGPGFYGMAPGGPYAGGTAPVYDRQVPRLSEQFAPGSRDSFYDYDSAVDLAIIDTFSQTWFRTEYLWMNYRAPNSRFIGATPLTVPPAVFNPTAFFPAVDRVTGVRPAQEGQLVSLKDADYQDNNGLRLTMGIPTQMFTFEASGFAMGQSESLIRVSPFLSVNSLPVSTVIPAIPLTRNGLPSRLDFILFDQGMEMAVQSNLQGADTKLVFGALTPNQTLEIAPLIGFNYLHYSNELVIRGSDAASATNHRIESQANNHIFGPEVGFRLETRSKWLTLGFEPKFTFGVNRVSNRVSTQQIFSAAELDRVQKDGLTRFSPVIELGTYARVRLAEHLNFTLGYQFMATTNVSQSEQNISWDSSSVLTNPPQINLIQREDDFWMQGVNVGLQWQF